MKSLSLKNAALITVLFMTGAAEAQMPPRRLRTCGVATPNIDLQLRIDYGELVYDETRSLQTVRGTLAPGTLGLTTYRINHAFSMTHNTRNQTCLRIDSVTVDIKVDQLKIFIDESLERGSCKYLKTKEHENEHVRIIRNTLREEAPRAKMDLTARLATIQPIDASRNFPETYMTALTDLQDQVEVMVRETVRDLERKIEDRNDAIDTSKSYRTILKDCY